MRMKSKLVIFLGLVAAISYRSEALADSTCTFENGLCQGWSLHLGAANWTLRSGSTPSSDTGPEGDHTTGNGVYAYLESSTPNYPKVGPFLLQSGPIDVGIGNVSFYYSMYGTDTGCLNLEALGIGGDWVALWSKSGDQGPLWQHAVWASDLSFFTAVRFVGVSGLGYTSDIALDDIRLSERITPAPSSSPAPSASAVPSGRPSAVPTASPTTLSVTTEAQLVANANLPSSWVDLGANIVLSTGVYLSGTSMQLVGHGFFVSGGGVTRCFFVDGATKLTIVVLSNLTLADGSTVDLQGNEVLK